MLGARPGAPLDSRVGASAQWPSSLLSLGRDGGPAEGTLGKRGGRFGPSFKARVWCPGVVAGRAQEGSVGALLVLGSRGPGSGIPMRAGVEALYLSPQPSWRSCCSAG